MPNRGQSKEDMVAAVAPRASPTSTDVRVRGLVGAHLEVVWRSLKRLGVPDDGVDDAVQQVFIVASRKIDVIRPGEERGYLLGIALRVASEARRSRARRREVLEEIDEKSTERGPEDDLDQKRQLQKLNAILETMDPELREVFVLFDLEELTLSEIARAANIPRGTIASRVRRAREHVRDALKRGEP